MKTRELACRVTMLGAFLDFLNREVNHFQTRPYPLRGQERCDYLESLHEAARHLTRAEALLIHATNRQAGEEMAARQGRN